MKRAFILGVASCAVACQTPNPTQPAPQTAAAEVPAEPVATASPFEDAQQRVCAGVEGPCTLTELRPAGDADNRLYVAEVAFVENPDPQKSWKYPNYESEDQCNPWALFLVDTKSTEPPRALAYLCNDGYGASGVGEDSWEVTGGRLTMSQNGGSNWRWAQSKTIDLVANTLVRQGADNYFATSPNDGEQQDMDFETLTLKASWFVWPCGTAEDTSQEFHALSIPRLALPAAFTAEGWKATSIADCSTRLDAAEGGFVIHGERSSAQDTRMNVVASGNTLFVEVMDDTLVASASGKWIHGDHLEVWASAEEPSKMEMDCVDLSQKGKAWQWGVDALTGAVTEAYGKPPFKLVAEHAPFAGGVRFKVTLPPDARSVTVVYSDSDDGKKQERLLSTSAFKFATVQTMGNMTDINAKYLTCAVASGKLAKTLTPMPPVENLP
ncbi:MAG: hypothetical protein R3E66_22905 [bacterium]